MTTLLQLGVYNYNLCFHTSKEEANIDRTEIANATAILDELLKEKDYDTNARPKEGLGIASW